ncbi:putative quinone oxidoreductase, YhdH/YhfP family [Thioflavicoccus mobilis 8321]|uniref:Putative quinone oxidoreductase, YhdH/YhfP family n=1 Tax=Thioflavicoccus mobilis 8321 TaxID=765912 RepID=L0H004_9GAMM|nr:YhdH/YhfP family quinone oxidoreductase [Thioflavicoccus mobilis]AGA91536.1 putative quinone oxidoreductase, YhdH/YhfP family [Thioflavicoccus mobilis 8321]
MTTYPALRIHNDDRGYRAQIESLPLPEPQAGEVLIQASYSSINYKDALAGTGRGKILRQFPLTGGIDAAGTVVRSRDARFREGDSVIATGYGLSFDHDGGYAHYLCAPADWLVPMPLGLDARRAMILGTAGFTAALALHRLQVNGQHPELGPLLVTGASGGVGSIAIDLASQQGYEVVAVSGKAALTDWLKGLGAAQVLGRDELPGGERPLEKATWGGAIDNVGGAMLARITRTLVPTGGIAAIGLAGGAELVTTVMPFILRGVSLLGINASDTPGPLRHEVWQRLASDWQPRHLDEILTDTVSLAELPDAFERLLEGRTHGRTLVTLGG